MCVTIDGILELREYGIKALVEWDTSQVHLMIRGLGNVEMRIN